MKTFGYIFSYYLIVRVSVAKSNIDNLVLKGTV